MLRMPESEARSTASARSGRRFVYNLFVHLGPVEPPRKGIKLNKV